MTDSPKDQWHRMCLLTGLSALVSICAAGAAWVLLRLINLLTHIALFHEVSLSSVSITKVSFSNLFSAAIVGAVLISLMARRFPIIRGHGLPEAMDAVLSNESRIKPSTAVVKPVSAAIAIGTGGPFGAEGPIIVTGGALGSMVGQLVSMSPAERKVLLASGAAAGMAATFGTPLAAVILAVELLLFEFSTRSFIPLVVASTIATGLHVALFGKGPLFSVPTHNFDGLEKLPLFLVLGICCGFLAVVCAKGLFITEAIFERLPVSEFWHPIIGAIGFASIGFFVPRALGVGYGTLGDILHGHLAATTLLAICLAKLIMWWWAISSGTSGGTLAPMLLIGGAFGALLGGGLAAAIPSANVSAQGFALVGMAAVFGSSTRTTFASMVFLFEVTGDYSIILPLMLCCVVARLITERFLTESIMTQKLAKRGVRVSSDYAVDPLRSTQVETIVSIDSPDREEDIAHIPVHTSALAALRIMIDTETDTVGILDGTSCIGHCTRDDIMNARLHSMTKETRQRGWWSNRIQPV